EHDFVFIADRSDRLLYASLRRRSVDPNWFNAVQPDLKDVLALVRTRAAAEPARATPSASSGAGANRLAVAPRSVRLQRFLGRPAIVAAVALVAADDPSANGQAGVPVVVSVKFIDEDVLAAIGVTLQLRDLRQVEATTTGNRVAPSSAQASLS